MINEPKEKAILRAYLALITGAVIYDGNYFEVEDHEQLEVIVDKLLSLGCHKQLSTHSRQYNCIYYENELITNLNFKPAKITQLYEFFI